MELLEPVAVRHPVLAGQRVHRRRRHALRAQVAVRGPLVTEVAPVQDATVRAVGGKGPAHGSGALDFRSGLITHGPTVSQKRVGQEGVEPSRLSAPELEPGVSASSTTSPCPPTYHTFQPKPQSLAPATRCRRRSGEGYRRGSGGCDTGGRERKVDLRALPPGGRARNLERIRGRGRRRRRRRLTARTEGAGKPRADVDCVP